MRPLGGFDDGGYGEHPVRSGGDSATIVKV